MSLRAKVVVALGVLAAVAAMTIGVWSYRATTNELYGQIDRSLDAAAVRMVNLTANEGPVDGPSSRRPPFESGAAAFGERPRSFEQIIVQVVSTDGVAVVQPTNATLPIDQLDRDVAAADAAGVSSRRDVRIDGEPYRLETVSRGGSMGAVQVARSLVETRQVLDQLRWVTVIAITAVTLLAGLVGWLVARTLTSRLERLSVAAEEVTTTGRLDVDVPVDGTDEAGRLGAAFSRMLDALARSRDAQTRLVQDAGHELRTPLTSLRTNLAVLRRHGDLPESERIALVADLESEARELSDLVNELVELATDARVDEPVEHVELGPLVERVADRVGRRTGRQLVLDLDDTVVRGQPTRLERAVGNLIDNAAKFDEGGTAPIEIALRHGCLEVRDRGPGIAPDDLERVFERFYRAVTMRGRPGSGLGLAIVRDVVETHGGRVFAAVRPGGGAVVGFELPVLRGTPAA